MAWTDCAESGSRCFRGLTGSIPVGRRTVGFISCTDDSKKQEALSWRPPR